MDSATDRQTENHRLF